jgi:hypothetical protein
VHLEVLELITTEDHIGPNELGFGEYVRAARGKEGVIFTQNEFEEARRFQNANTVCGDKDEYIAKVIACAERLYNFTDFDLLRSDEDIDVVLDYQSRMNCAGFDFEKLEYLAAIKWYENERLFDEYLYSAGDE